MSEKFKNILVTGGAGYVGSLLVPQLLDLGYRVTVYDILFFGDDFLPKTHPQFNLIQGDIRDSDHFYQACYGIDAVIHLACISNDASFELDEALSTSINLTAFEPVVIAAKKAGVRRFIYASSSSVYGVSDAPEVTEDHPLVPLTLYNKYKGMCEPLLFKHVDERFTGVVIRPATICGYAPRQRLDLTVNILTNHAVHTGERIDTGTGEIIDINGITVLGGGQRRPNLHVQDMCDLYQLLLTVPKELIAREIFNVGYQNRSIMDIARIVKNIVEKEFPKKSEIPIRVTETNDIRSYHINSDKIEKILGFRAKHTIEEAVQDLCSAFRAGKLPNSLTDNCYFNVRQLKALEVV